MHKFFYENDKKCRFEAFIVTLFYYPQMHKKPMQ